MSTTPQTPSRRQTFEEKIKALEKLSSSQPEVTIQEMLALFGTSSHYVFLCFLALPFLQPIPIPGLSQLVGSIVIISGICIFLGRSLWLPRRLKNKAIQSTTIAKIIATWKRWSQKLSKWIRVRGKFMAKDFFLRRFNGLLIIISGLMLVLPVPFPLTNTIPALAIFLLGLGSIKDDGVLVALGWLAFALAALYFFMILIVPLNHFFASRV